MINAINVSEILDESDKLIYSTYRSKYNKESLDTLRYGMNLVEFIKHREYVTQQDALEEAAHKDQAADIKNK